MLSQRHAASLGNDYILITIRFNCDILINDDEPNQNWQEDLNYKQFLRSIMEINSDTNH